MKYKVVSVVFLILIMSVFSFVNAQERPQNVRNRQLMNIRDIQKLTPMQEELVLKHIKSTYPEERYQKLLDLKQTRVEVYNRLLLKAYREMQYMESLKERDSEQYEKMKEKRELDIECKKFVDQYKSTENVSEKENLKNQIVELLKEIFDIRQSNREKEIERLEKRLAEAKENNRKRKQNKDKIVAERLEELLGEQDWMKW